MTLYYFEKFWNEPTGDPLTNSWGTAKYYLEADSSGQVLRQLEIYQNGQKLKYDETHFEDEYGKLTDQPISLEEFAEFKIEKDKFEEVWSYKQS